MNDFDDEREKLYEATIKGKVRGNELELSEIDKTNTGCILTGSTSIIVICDPMV